LYNFIAGISSVATSLVYSPLLDSVADKLTSGFDIKHEVSVYRDFSWNWSKFTNS